MAGVNNIEPRKPQQPQVASTPAQPTNIPQTANKPIIPNSPPIKPAIKASNPRFEQALKDLRIPGERNVFHERFHPIYISHHNEFVRRLRGQGKKSFNRKDLESYMQNVTGQPNQKEAFYQAMQRSYNKIKPLESVPPKELFPKKSVAKKPFYVQRVKEFNTNKLREYLKNSDIKPFYHSALIHRYGQFIANHGKPTFKRSDVERFVNKLHPNEGKNSFTKMVYGLHGISPRSPEKLKYIQEKKKLEDYKRVHELRKQYKINELLSKM